MKLLVLGATGMTGAWVVRRALDGGHEVVVLVRDAKRVHVNHLRLEVRTGSPISRDDVMACMRDIDAVVHCLGIGGKGDGRHTTLISNSVKVAADAMTRHGVRRIVCMSNVGAGGSGTWLANRLVIPLFLRWLQPIIEDKNRMEAALRATSLEWVSVRLPNIIEGPVRPVRLSANGRHIGMSITAQSAAAFLLDQTTGTDHVHRTPSISN